MIWFLKWIGFSLVILFTGWIVPGITVKSLPAAMVVTIVIALINVFIKPALLLITLPINILTLGLFTLVINALLLMFVAYLTPGFSVEGFGSAFLASIVISIFTIGINLI